MRNLNLKLPPWLPKPLRERLSAEGKLVIRIRFSQPEKRMLRRRKPIRPSVWAERHRVVTMSALPGPWKGEVTPYLTEIMDASVHVAVETIAVCKAPQVGGTEFVHNFVGYAIDRAPGPVLYVYPDENTGKENMRDRIIPMIRSSARLKSYLTGTQDDEGLLRINLKHMPIYIAWARSPSRLANKPIKYLIFDETDKYPDTAGKRESDPVSLGRKRGTTYHDRKIFLISSTTTETGVIWTALRESQVVFDYHVLCPDCGGLHVMSDENIRVRDVAADPDPARVETERMGYYECPDCGGNWTDRKRDMAVRMGVWKDRETALPVRQYLDEYRPRKIAFHIPAWLSRFVSMSEVAAARMRAYNAVGEIKNMVAYKDYCNGTAAIPWTNVKIERAVDMILALRDERPANMVPAGGVVAALTGAADTHGNGFWYEIRAWGFGPEQDSWCVRAGFVDTFEALHTVMFESVYKDVNGSAFVVPRMVIDSGGNRTADVYRYVRANKGRVMALKGERRMTAPYAFSNIDTYPNKVRIPGGLKLFRVNTTLYKDQLASKLNIPEADPGAWRYYAEFPVAWAAHMTAEYVDDDGVWQCRTGKDNHLWDLGVYGLALYDFMGIANLRQGENRSAKPKTEPGRKLPAWFGNRESGR